MKTLGAPAIRSLQPSGTPAPRRAFTLTELLVVISVLISLAAILFPTVARAVREAHRAECVSNLRQCGHALSLYAGDWGELPAGEATYAALAQAPTCDKEDTWRTSCSVASTPPRVGSYGYVRLCPEFVDSAAWNAALNQDHPPSLMVSIFYGNRQVKPFVGMEMALTACGHGVDCLMPDRLITLELDGSAHHRKVGRPEVVAGKTYEVFSWPAAFQENDRGN